ncbi:phosphate starvation-inducible protein PsiF [Cupriavidus sp. USMAA2-4]|uniref:Phosphate starvation-inducible protein PsiF n=1 Tax=Cupriavidus malaysiensis TaxID=367825 RepID=A0ABM6F8I0_9BURK|nr:MULTISPECIES: PsiF family protein [Cupriavidus]AOY94072.1 phosphate starvation-inducible protein PsiF [Cupriavidus sp. USMAA2-4]AOZ01110.1 phosphate starvation-inducible protein PsiF [Cupriavidus sp. USMAHM13]AOZ07938.1 phosphate starvation-inducible protein PsiF [Cupriavidus malaysiensis]
MKKMIAICALLTPLFATGAFAQGSAPAAANSQQDKMKACNTQASGKKGDERKTFMKDCLSNKPAAAAAPMTQQEKMSACSKQGKGKKGDDYKSFMKDCLSK